MGVFDTRVNYKPFEYNEITEPFIKAIWSGHWTHYEFDFKSDKQDFLTKLTEGERGVITRAALLISQVEVSLKAYWSNIGKILPVPEIADVGAVFGNNEVQHSRAYSQILTVLNLDEEFQNMLTSGVVEGRVKYLSKYVNKIYKNDRKNIVYSLILFTLFTENVSLFSQFYTILGFNRYNNILKDVANVVQYTTKEETIHANFGVTLVNQIREEYPELFDEELEQKIIEETEEAIKAETELIKWMLQDFENEFLSEEILINFVKSRLNTCLKNIGIQYHIPVSTKVLRSAKWFDEEILAPSSTDFFYKKPIDYAKKNKIYTIDNAF